MKFRWIIYTAIVLAIAVYYFKTPNHPTKGDNAVNSIVKNVEGVEFKLSELWGVKNIALVFTSTTCSVCIKEIDLIKKDDLNYKGYEFVFISDAPIINLDYPVFVDTDKHAFEDYNVHTVPQTFLINKSGVVEERIVGY